jgi:antitoxin ParD1/3/4
MAASKAISVELKARQQAILKRQLDSGHYENASEVIGDALRALDERDAAYDEFLRAKVKASLANKRPRVPIDQALRERDARLPARGKPPNVQRKVVLLPPAGN